ncbi:MAG: PorP/SprF family type IX secretion system membrane protein [Saprospiraceae bacterium]|nr:PorP/SprF family type IX secretion system membrane protein [Saprospiraceae bacterium]
MKIYKLWVISVLVVWGHTTFGQQLANSSHFGSVRTAWNPAYTAVGNDMIFDGFFRMQWLGFSGAPVSGFTSFQYPLLDYNMSAGALLHFDKTGPVSKIGLQLNYAYKLKEFLGKYGQLSLGLSGNFQQYAFNGNNQLVNDDDDQLLFQNRASSFFPSLGGGFYYVSNTREYKGNTFFVGGAVNQIYTTKVLVNDLDQVRQKHIHFNLGGRFYSYDSYVEPMITANIVNPDIIDVLYSLKYEMEDTFWAGLGYSSAGMMALQGGVILDKFGNRYAKLRVGGLATYGVGSSLAKTGPGFEFYIGYNFDMK